MIQVNKDILKDEIRYLMEAINEQFDAIGSYETKVPQIEYDIIMENVRKLYENLHMLQRTEDPYSYFEGKVHEQAAEHPVSDGKAVGEIPQQVPVPEIHAEPEPVKEPAGKAAEEPLIRIQFASPEPGPVREVTPPAREKRQEVTFKQEQTIEVSLFPEEENDFSGKLKEARERSLGPRLRPRKPGDLKSAIGINEKFLIINELFGGNLRDYNETIETLNGFKDVRTAFDFLDLLRKKNLWDAGSPVFQQLKELVEKKFT
jgi:hypothetical protein